MEEEVGQLVSQARKLQGEGDLDGAMAEVRKGLARYPEEARIEALKETLEREIALSGRRARLSDLEEVKSLSLKAPAASTAELDSIQERTHTVAASYPGETEFQSLVREVDQIATERAARTLPGQEPRPRKPPTPAIPQQVLWIAGAVAVLMVVLAVVLLTAHFWRSKPPGVVRVPVQFQVSPPGATVRIDGRILDTSQPVSLHVGRYQVEASLDGYESAGTTLSVTPGSLPVANLTLQPVAQSFRITAPDLEHAEVFLDDHSLGTLEGGRFSHRSLTPGPHNIRVQVLKAQTQQARFSFESKPGRAPEVRLPLEAMHSQLLVISSKGNRGFIAGTMPSISVKLDGNALGLLTPGGLELTNLEPGIHQLTLGAGAGARTISFASESGPMLDAVISSDRRPDAYPDRKPGAVSFRANSAPIQTEQPASSSVSSPPNATGVRTADSRPPAVLEMHDFEAAIGSTDPAVLREFLSRNPSGEYHDRVAERLDDLTWAEAETGDATSFNAYLNRFPGGRHADQARARIAALTPAPVPNAAAPKLERKAPAAVDDKGALLRLVRQYQQAYHDENVDQLKALWPNMNQQQVSALNDFFGHAQRVELDCKLIGEPVISGTNSTLKLTQTLTYLPNSKIHPVSSKTQLIMRLRKQSSNSGTSDWRIESIR